MIFELNDGRAVIFEPTTDLMCSGCRKPVNIYTTLKKKEGEDWRDVANFMFEFHSSPKPDGLAQGQYFYLHKGCARLEDYLVEVTNPNEWRLISKASRDPERDRA